jgi:DNA-binding LytR/AlgR family response regulator
MPEPVKCIIVDDEPIARDILERHLARIDRLQVVASCKSAIEAFNAINSKKVDLIFLDINMPEISGLAFAKSINKEIKIIFTTAYREYAVDGFDLQAVDYLLKPISFERLLQAVDKYLDENSKMIPRSPSELKVEKTDHIFVRSDRKMIRLNFQDITFIESFSDYLKIHLTDHTIVTRETITSIEAKLPKDNFVRIHRSFIVSLTNIVSFTNESVEVNGTELPISRTYKSEVLRLLELPG